jgi:hypothetical protein
MPNLPYMKGRGAGLLLAVATLVNCGGQAPMAVPSGPRSFVVTSTLSASDGSTSLSVTSHVFTLMVDGDQMTAIYGANGVGGSSVVQPSPDGFVFVTPPIYLPVVYGSCPTSVRYDDLTVTLDGSGGLHGHGTGLLQLPTSSPIQPPNNTAVTMSLIGVPDTVPPVLTLYADGYDDPTDPFDSVTVWSSEPLSAPPVLRAAGGDAVAGGSSPSGVNLAFSFGGTVLRRYGEQYSIDISGVRDLAGNAAVASVPDDFTITTRPPPPLVAPDGFESVTDATLGGAQILSDPTDPIISGARSLYIPPVPLGSSVLVALRLAIPTGATTISLAYRSVNANAPTGMAELGFASVGGGLWVRDLDISSASTATGVIGGAQVTVGPVTMATMPLPPDSTNEIVIHYFAANLYNVCAGIESPPIPGLIIDDLRVE